MSDIAVTEFSSTYICETNFFIICVYKNENKTEWMMDLTHFQE